MMSRPEFSNWGRWGPDDQLGALNLMTPESILRAVRLVTKGVVYNLAVPPRKGWTAVPLLPQDLAGHAFHR
jgi:hypothetical protein